MYKVVATFLLFAFKFTSLGAVSCKDQNNKDVDWFVGYKMPILNDNSLTGVREGTAFYYMDVNMDSLTPSLIDITSNNQALAYTLKQYYVNKSSINSTFVLYNDAKPDVFQHLLSPQYNQILANSDYGHTKGVVYFEESGGFWLVHSIPRFPSKDSYIYPSSGKRNGQSILCMTFNYDQLTKIGTQLYYNRPLMYAKNIAPTMESDNPDLAKVILQGAYKNSSPFSNTLTLQSRGGQNFRSFAKTAKFNYDIYQDLVAYDLRASLWVETWRRENFDIPIDCSRKYRIYDAMSMKVQKSTEFKYTKDHSKIAVSADYYKPYVCIGDINRMTSQYKRGGGTICISLPKLYNTYHSTFFTTRGGCSKF